MIWMLAMACFKADSVDPSTEAERFSVAANASTPLSEALKGCRQIDAVDSRGDCVSLALDSHGAATRAACESIESERWEGECYFLLAESEREQDLARAIATCDLSSFARECIEHLVRSEAKLALRRAPEELQETIAVLEQSKAATDAAVLFWQEWAVDRVEADLMVSERDCGVAKDVESCQIGMRRARKQLVQERGLENRCRAADEGRALLVLSDGRAVLGSGVPLKPGGGACAK